MSAVRTGADLDVRLAELVADFSAVSLAKSGGRSRADIVRGGPYRGLRSLAWPETWICPPEPRPTWSIVYRRPDGSLIHTGVTIGHTKAEVIGWLILHRRAWPA